MLRKNNLLTLLLEKVEVVAGLGRGRRGYRRMMSKQRRRSDGY